MEVSEEENEITEHEENAYDHIVETENVLGPFSGPISLNDSLSEDLDLNENIHASESQISRRYPPRGGLSRGGQMTRPNNSGIRPRQREGKAIVRSMQPPISRPVHVLEEGGPSRHFEEHNEPNSHSGLPPEPPDLNLINDHVNAIVPFSFVQDKHKDAEMKGNQQDVDIKDASQHPNHS